MCGHRVTLPGVPAPDVQGQVPPDWEAQGTHSPLPGEGGLQEG